MGIVNIHFLTHPDDSDVPDPGTPEAIKRGCICPVPDESIVLPNGTPVFVFVAGCALHGGGNWRE